jgi:hypothetical protein
MNTSEYDVRKQEQFGFTTRMLAEMCHNCGICARANKSPNSAFEKLMRWHRTWCPAWAAHTQVYGERTLS